MAGSCTHCGLCLESCPTYTLWDREPDSPRGRIVLIEDGLGPGGNVGTAMIEHIDACVGCLACVTACPEDVPYGDLLTRARAAIEPARPLQERLRLRAASEARSRSGRLRALSGTHPVPHFTPAVGEARGRVGLLLGCTQRAAHGPLHSATLRVLAAEGYDVIAPTLPACCGATSLAAGDPRGARKRAKDTVDAFRAIGGVDHVVVNAGACGVAMKDYGRLLGTARAAGFAGLVRDVHELLAAEPPRATLAPLALRVAVHDACQLRHGQGVTDQVREVLRRIPAVTLIELPTEAGACCGANGLYDVTNPEASAQLGERQARALIESGAQVIVSGDHGCLRQLQRSLQAHGHEIPVHHPIELLARSIAAAQ